MPTIVSIPRHPGPGLQPLIHEPGNLPGGEELVDTHFKVRLASTEGRRSKASYLIEQRYAWRGYEAPGSAETPANRIITLCAFAVDHLAATISVGVDSGAGLAIEALYPGEVAALRAPGILLCEFTKLAIDSMVRSKSLLAAIFHIAYIYARRIRHCARLLIEVNPRHVLFYEHMLGFEKSGPERMDPRVNAPAVLLKLELSHAEREIARHGGHAERGNRIRLLYPYFFSPHEEHGIERRLRHIC